MKKNILLILMITMAAMGDSCILKQEELKKNNTDINSTKILISQYCIDNYLYIQIGNNTVQKMAMKSWGYSKKRIEPETCGCLEKQTPDAISTNLF